MKANKVKIYARALAEIERQQPASAKASARQEKLVENFLKLLEKEGLKKKAKEIVALAEDIILQKQGKRKIIFETARKITAGQKKMLHEVAKEGDIIKEKINPDLIAGVKIIINESKQFDGSLQKKLQEIF